MDGRRENSNLLAMNESKGREDHTGKGSATAPKENTVTG